MMHIRLGPALGLAVVMTALASGMRVPLQAQQKPAGEQQKPAGEKPAAPALSPDQQDQVALLQILDGVTNGTTPAPTAINIRWVSNDLIKSQGDSVYIPFTIAIDRAQLSNPSAFLSIRAISKGAAPPAAPAAAGAAPARPAYPWDTTQPVDIPADGVVSRAIALPPGAYEVIVAVREKSGAAPAPGGAAAKAGVVRHDLTVEKFSETPISTSSVILARALETLSAPMPPDKQQENPYVFGPLKVTPAHDRKFTTASDLQILFWIYGASQTGGKPDVQVDFNFHLKQPDGTFKYFNKTAPQNMNKDTLPPEFNLTAGHQLLSSLAIPLKSFPAGAYLLEIKVTDKPSGMNVTQKAEFTVSAS